MKPPDESTSWARPWYKTALAGEQMQLHHSATYATIPETLLLFSNTNTVKPLVKALQERAPDCIIWRTDATSLCCNTICCYSRNTLFLSVLEKVRFFSIQYSETPGESTSWETAPDIRLHYLVSTLQFSGNKSLTKDHPFWNSYFVWNILFRIQWK